MGPSAGQCLPVSVIRCFDYPPGWGLGAQWVCHEQARKEILYKIMQMQQSCPISSLGTHIPDHRQRAPCRPLRPCLTAGCSAGPQHKVGWCGCPGRGHPGRPAATSQPASCSGTAMGLGAHGSRDGAGVSDRGLEELETSLAHSPVLMRAHPSDSPFPSRVYWDQEEGAETVLLPPETHSDVGA